MESKSLSVSEAARLLGVKPKDITNLFYNRRIRDDLAPIVGGRRLIPKKLLTVIEMELRRAGRQVTPLTRPPICQLDQT